MRVLIVYAHPNPMSFTAAILQNFTRGLKQGGHDYEIIDLYKTKFNPVLTEKDSAFFMDYDIPQDMLPTEDIKEMIITRMRGALMRFLVKHWLKNKDRNDLIKLFKRQRPKDVLKQQEKVSRADAIVFITQVIWMHFPALVKGWMERVFTYGFAYRLTEKGWKGDSEGRIPLLNMKKALIMQPAFFSENISRKRF